MYNVKLAPLKGITKEKMPPVQLKSLTELLLTDPNPDLIYDNSNVESHFENTVIMSEDNMTKINSSSNNGGDSNNSSSINGSNMMINENCPSPKINSHSSSQNNAFNSYSKKQKPSALGISDVNCLWTVYLNQQHELGDISDRQAMAKSYHSLNADQVRVLRDLHNDSKSIEINQRSAIVAADEPLPTIRKRRKTQKNNQEEELPRKERRRVNNKKALPKSVNKRQQRKKRIRDELKRQLNTFTTLSETEGFPWKAIVSKTGFRDLKLVGWPRAIPKLKRIDDFNPIELNLFEEGLDNGSIKIVQKKK